MTEIDARRKVSVAKMVMSPNVLVDGTAETAPRKDRMVSSTEPVFPPSKTLRRFEEAMSPSNWLDVIVQRPIVYEVTSNS